MAIASPEPTATGFTAIPVLRSKAGSRSSRSPVSATLVVVARMTLRGSLRPAQAARAREEERRSSAASARTGEDLIFSRRFSRVPPAESVDRP
jgi:hypothetical protein